MSGLEEHPYESFLGSTVDHPAHYGGADNPYEAIKVIEAWELGFNLGNTVKYIARVGRKLVGASGSTEARVEDLCKAVWYLQREIELARQPAAAATVRVSGQ